MHLLKTCGFAFWFLSMAVFPCDAQTDIGEIMDEMNKNKVQEVSGPVRNIDTVGSWIEIDGVTPSGNSAKMRLKVPDDARISQGTETISLDDIDIEDSLTVRYTVDRSSGELRVVEIIDDNDANNQFD